MIDYIIEIGWDMKLSEIYVMVFFLIKVCLFFLSGRVLIFSGKILRFFMLV